MKTYVKAIIPDILRVLLLPLCIFRIKNNRVLFTGLTGGTTNEYSCNPMYLCEYLMNQDPGKIEIIWAVSDPKKYEAVSEKGIRLVKHFSLGSFQWLLTSKVIVTNGSYAPWFPFRKGQYLINTWHGGGAYKRVENSKPNANWATRHRASFCAENIDLFVSSCAKATKELFRGSYGYQGEVMEVGMPRNDFLVNQELQAAVSRVYARYGFAKEDKIVLYAPTFRYSEKEVVLDADRLLSFLERDGKKWHFLYRAHRYQDERMKIHVTGKRIVDAAMDPDMQELLAATDILLTDYSSVIWDYSYLYRPCYLFTPDLEEYIQKTGFYVGIDQWPYETVKNQEELERCIADFDPAVLRERIQKHHALMGAAESGRACAYVADRIKEVCGL